MDGASLPRLSLARGAGGLARLSNPGVKYRLDQPEHLPRALLQAVIGPHDLDTILRPASERHRTLE